MTHDKTISTYSMDKLIMMNTVKVLLGKLEAHMLDRVTQSVVSVGFKVPYIQLKPLI